MTGLQLSSFYDSRMYWDECSPTVLLMISRVVDHQVSYRFIGFASESTMSWSSHDWAYPSSNCTNLVIKLESQINSRNEMGENKKKLIGVRGKLWLHLHSSDLHAQILHSIIVTLTPFVITRLLDRSYRTQPAPATFGKDLKIERTSSSRSSDPMNAVVRPLINTFFFPPLLQRRTLTLSRLHEHSVDVALASHTSACYTA